MIDLVVIGAGPAGFTAAIYAARAGKSVTVFERESMGGQISHAFKVENYPAFEEISGLELSDKLCAHAIGAGAEIEFASVDDIQQKNDGTFVITASGSQYEARAVIYAGGAKPRSLELEKEQEFVGKGISYCALCDGAFFKGKNVAVVGGGNSAFSDAMFLAGICNDVTIIHRRDEFRAEKKVIDNAKAKENIRFLTNSVVKELKGSDHLTSIMVQDVNTKEVKEISLDGLFVSMGRVADNSIISKLVDSDDSGYIKAYEDAITKTSGFFVAGDCRSKEVRQLTTATADGTVAATAACKYLDNN